jgi:hypothetical protein
LLLPSANPLKDDSSFFSLGLPLSSCSSSSIRLSISKASNIASFLVAAAFFNLSAETSSSDLQLAL